MKKFFALLAVMAALLIPAKAMAYSNEMAQLAEAMNAEIAGTDNVKSISYDGSNLILTMDDSIVTQEESELLESVSDSESIKPMIMAQLDTCMDAETRSIFSQLLGAFNTNLMLRLPLKNGRMFDFVITPEELAGN